MGTAAGRCPNTALSFINSALHGRASPTVSVETTETARKSRGARTPVCRRAFSTSVGTQSPTGYPAGYGAKKGKEGRGLELAGKAALVRKLAGEHS